MRGGWVTAVLVLTLLEAGCVESTATIPVAASRSGASVTPSTAPSPASPSVDPQVAGAATAYRAAAGEYNRAVAKLGIGWETAIVSQPMTARVKAHYAGMAGAERTFAAAIREVTFPTGMKSHIKALLDATDACAALDLKASRITVGSQVGAREIFIAERLSSSYADLVRQDFKVLGVNL